MKNEELGKIQNSEFGIQREEVAQGREGATRICILLTQNTVVGCNSIEKLEFEWRAETKRSTAMTLVLCHCE